MPENLELHRLRRAVAAACLDVKRHPTDPAAQRAVIDAREAYAVAKTLDLMRTRLAGLELSPRSRRLLANAAADFTTGAAA